MRQDHQQFAVVSRLRQPGLQTPQIVLDHRPNGGVGDGGGKALELLDLWQHVRRCCHIRVLQARSDGGGGLLLMRRVAPGMQKTDRHCLDVCPRQLFDGGVQGGLVERGFHRSVGPHAFADRQAEAARDQRRGRGHAQIVAFGLQPLPHFDDVAVALGREHADAGGFTLQQCVGGGGGAVDDAASVRQQVFQRHVQPFGGENQALQHALRLVRGRGGGLGDDCFAVGGGDDDVGERAADIDTDCVGHQRIRSLNMK